MEDLEIVIQNIREVAAKFNCEIDEKVLPNIAKAKLKFHGLEKWHKCPCYPKEDETHGCGSSRCIYEIDTKGICHCNLFKLKGFKKENE